MDFITTILECLECLPCPSCGEPSRLEDEGRGVWSCPVCGTRWREDDPDGLLSTSNGAPA